MPYFSSTAGLAGMARSRDGSLPMLRPISSAAVREVYDTVIAGALASYSQPDVLASWLTHGVAGMDRAAPSELPVRLPAAEQQLLQTSSKQSLNDVAETTKANAANQLDAALQLLSLGARMRQDAAGNAFTPADGQPATSSTWRSPGCSGRLEQPLSSELRGAVGTQEAVGEASTERAAASKPVPRAARPTNSGSRGHPELCRRPCAFFSAAAGCMNGAKCGYCHVPHVARVPHLDKRQRDQLKEVSERERVALVTPLLHERLVRWGVADTPAAKQLLAAVQRHCATSTNEVATASLPEVQDKRLSSKRRTLQSWLAKTHSLRALLSLLFRGAGALVESEPKVSGTIGMDDVVDAVNKLRDYVESLRCGHEDDVAQPDA